MTNGKYIVLGLLMTLALNVSARTFEVGERLYFNGTPSNFPTWKNDAELWVQFKNGEANYWIPAQWKGDLPYVEITAASAGDWTHVVMARCQPGAGYGNIYNKTGDITIYENKNYMQNFCYGDGWKDAYWGCYIPAPTKDPSTWSLPCENEEICTSAAGTEYILAPKNYDYSNKTQNHAWFEYDGSNWIRIQGTDEWNEASDKNHTITLGGAGYDRYFFYQCSTPSMCRLVRIRLNQDCSEGAPGACAITTFIAVASEANVTDQTCAVDGLVAFDDKVNAGDLMVWCEGVDTMTIANSALETPQTFKLIGFDASSTKTYTLHTKFLNGTSACEASCKVTVKPPTATITTHTTTQTPGDMNLARFTEEDVTLTPNNQSSTYFQWTNTYDDTKISGTYPDNRNITFTAPTDSAKIEYVFLATNDPPAPEGNLISNGAFEDPTLDANLESNYSAWGRGNTSYYSTNPGASGGYAITDNASVFWHEYQGVTAHEGSYFGLFDSKIYTSSDLDDQAAWIARSGSKNPKLKVQAGISYLFSFWVANINAYYQMNNGARLQFQISYNGGTTWDNLGSEINLGNFKDSHWHGMSSLATPDVSSTNVILRVINKNKSNINIGNDFALDDIRFEAVTSRSSNIAAYEIFPIQYIQCIIDTAIFAQRQPTGCGTTTADVDYTVNFVHPRGDLYIYEGATELAHIAHATIGDDATTYNGVLLNQPADNADHVLTVYFKDDNGFQTNAPQTYVYHAKAVPAISVVSTDWTPAPACDVTTATLTAVIRYTNQNGTLSANVDGGTPVDSSYTIESNDTKEVTIVIPGVVADGKTGHVLNVNFNGSHGCKITGYVIPTAAPYMPSVAVSAPEIQTYACGDATYSVKVSATYTNSQLHDIIFEDWKTGPGQYVHITPTANNGKAEHTFTYDWDATPTTHMYNVYFDGATACNHNVSYTSPAEPVMAIQAVTPADAACDNLTSVSFSVDYTNQRGQMRYWRDKEAYATKSISPDDMSSLSSGTVTISNIPADGLTHKLYVQFDGPNSCEDSVEFTTKLSQHIDNLTVSGIKPSVQCGESPYNSTIQVDFPYDKAIGKDIILLYEGRDTTVTVTANPLILTIPMTATDLTGQVMKVRYSDAPTTCVTSSNSYNTPIQLSCRKDTAIICEGEPYTWPYNNVPYGPFNTVGWDTETNPANIYDTLFVYVRPKPEITLLTVDTIYDNATTITLPYTLDKGQPDHFDITIGSYNFTQPYTVGSSIVLTRPSGMATGDYTVSVSVFDSLITCFTTANTTIHIAGVPTVSNLTVTPREIACGESSYKVDVHIDYMNPRGKLLLEDKTNNIIYSYSVPTVTAVPYNTPQTLDTVITIASMTPASLNWEAYFTGWTSATTTSAAPTVPSMVISSVNPSTAACSKLSNVTFDLSYTYQQGTLRYYVDNKGDSTKAISPKNTTAQSFTGLLYDGIPADGKAHKLYVTFDGTNSCKDSVTFTAPLSQVIDSVVVSGVPATILCDEMSYTANVAVHMPYDATGKSIVISYESTSTTIPVSGNPTTTTLTLTSTDATGLTVSAAYSDASTCSTNSKPYNAPTRWTCDRDTADICLGDTYTWHSTAYAPTAAGTYGYKDNYDSLCLIVHAEPVITMTQAAMICEDENSIRLPFKVSDGTPNKFDISIAGHAFTQDYDGTDTIVLTRPTDVAAGTYTATVTVRDTSVTCFSTATTSFTIAMPDRVYSKWTDLLFVDNSANLFTAYQWFDENDKELSTNQYLYDPNGLPGMYYCRVTTTDGQTLYTCLQTFEEAIPSRTIQNEAQARTVMVYDYMGHRIEGEPRNGIFIVVEEVNGVMKSRKIAIYE